MSHHLTRHEHSLTKIVNFTFKQKSNMIELLLNLIKHSLPIWQYFNGMMCVIKAPFNILFSISTEVLLTHVYITIS